jgi:hypothetical protein
LSQRDSGGGEQQRQRVAVAEDEDDAHGAAIGARLGKVLHLRKKLWLLLGDEVHGVQHERRRLAVLLLVHGGGLLEQLSQRRPRGARLVALQRRDACSFVSPVT